MRTLLRANSLLTGNLTGKISRIRYLGRLEHAKASAKWGHIEQIPYVQKKGNPEGEQGFLETVTGTRSCLENEERRSVAL